MNIVICADVHLDSHFSLFPGSSEKAMMRSQEQRLAFLKVINEVKTRNAGLLLIPGDLFEGNRVSSDTIDFLKKAFLSISSTFVVIAPGNHDPAVTQSPYLKEEWPENVYIFKGPLEVVRLTLGEEEKSEFMEKELADISPKERKKVNIYGGGFTSQFCTKPLLSQPLPQLDKNALNILCMHGVVTSGQSDYNAISEEILEECGFDLCVLGHNHIYSGVKNLNNTVYVYPGICEGRDFSEPSPCGILTGTVEKGKVDLNFKETSVRNNSVVSVDISETESYDEITAAITAACPATYSSDSIGGDIYKVILTGELPPEFKLSVRELTKRLEQQYFYIKIINNTRVTLNENLLSEEISMRGFFVKNMCEYSNSVVYDDALRYGLRAFEGEVTVDEA